MQLRSRRPNEGLKIQCSYAENVSTATQRTQKLLTIVVNLSIGESLVLLVLFICVMPLQTINL